MSFLFKFTKSKPKKPKSPPTPTFLEERPKKGGSKHRRGLFKCNNGECRNTYECRISEVKNKKSQSCGCYAKEVAKVTKFKHGHNCGGAAQVTNTYISWKSMIQRCTNKNNPSYYRYGAKGIEVCERWYKFENFLEDMGKRPKNLTIERIDNTKGYYKENCKWATRTEQNNNKSDTIFIITANTKISLANLYKKSNSSIPLSKVRLRLEQGWELERALHQPLARSM